MIARAFHLPRDLTSYTYSGIVLRERNNTIRTTGQKELLVSTFRFKKIFPDAHTLLAVISVEDEVRALRDAHIAKNEGADGIFLTSSLPAPSLFKIYNVVKRQLPNYWIGLKCFFWGGSRGPSKDSRAMDPRHWH